MKIFSVIPIKTDKLDVSVNGSTYIAYPHSHTRYRGNVRDKGAYRHMGSGGGGGKREEKGRGGNNICTLIQIAPHYIPENILIGRRQIPQ